ncbi:cytochrome P450 [Aspergillus pseudoustus]|uniref:Cytochrome P450 n=1 Tax=Aspergillus pseudoustus TaxID=1810923 RepID=A0ABR4KC60_9EURO
MRLKQIGNGFSPAALKNMESMFDRHIANLMGSMEKHAKNGTVLDLKQALAFYGYDITGQLAFDHNFETQVMDDPDKMPPLNDHFFLGNIYGCVANLLPWVRSWTAWLPWVQKMIKSRVELTGVAAECIARAMKRHDNEAEPGTLLAALIGATNPDTGEKLTADEINSESFLFLVAGAHTTSSALVVLLFHLLHDKEILDKLIQEIDTALPGHEHHIYPFKGLEAALPYGMACIREAFRIHPTAALLLPRVVTNPEGAQIGQWRVPQGTNCAIVSTCLHHNPDIWGASHDEYDPSRFLAGSERYNPAYHTYLLHFGQGNRQCIGRNIALMSVWKILVSVLKNYELELVDPDEKFVMLEYGVGDKKGPLNVRVKRRSVEARE